MLSRRPRRRLLGFALFAALFALGFAVPLALAAPPSPAPAPGEDVAGRNRLTLYVPATAGGGWSQTAIAMKAALEAEGLVDEVTIIHRPGGGGLIGLAQFVEARRGDPNFLIVGGLGMIYSAKANASAVTPLNATPIARLARDYYVVAVPARSPLRNAQDLVAALRSRPDAVRWVGDQPSGGAERVIWQIAAAAHVAPLSLPYFPRFGAGEVADFLQQGDPQFAGVAGYGELAPAMAGGGIRVLGVAAEGSRFGGLPTLRAQGLDIVAANWRGVFAPPGIRPDQRQRLIATMAAMARSSVWRDTLRRERWDDCFLAGDGFSAFVADEQQRIFASDLPYGDGGDDAVAQPSPRWQWVWPALAAVLAALAAILGYVAWRGRRIARRAAKLRETLGPIDAHRPLAEQSDVAQAINSEFDAWKLSTAERDVAWFLLKGLSMKEIARLRGASERTVRQQARAVYSKAGLEGRSDLAAHILDQCLAPGGR
jgi:putative tricarboxylic transport membrane protein